MRDFLRCIAAFLKRDAALALSYPSAFVMSLAGSIGRVVVLWLPGQLLADSRLFDAQGGFVPFALVGTSMMGFFMASYGGFAGAIRTEQAMGTLESVLMTPARIPAIVLGSNAWTMTYALLDTGLMLLVGGWMFGVVFQGSLWAALVVLLLTTSSFAAIGILSAAYAVVFKRGDPFRVVVAAASFLIGGVVYPVDVLPTWVRGFSALLPISHGARALRAILLEGTPLSDLWREVFALVAFAAIGIPSAIAAFGWAVGRAKRDGSLLHF